MPWLPPENELDFEQREFLNNLLSTTRNLHILGFPGSGKTVLLLYAAKKIKEQNPKAKILFVEFTHALINMLEAAILQLPYRDIQVITYYDFFYKKYPSVSFDYILCDEVQDIPLKVIERMKRVGNRIIVAGDPSQTIYESDPKWGIPPCTPDELVAALNPISTNLTIIHRLTKFVINAVDNFLPDMKITSGKPSMVRHHTRIRLWKAANSSQEVKAIYDDAMDYLKYQTGQTIAVLLPSHRKILRFANLFLEAARKPSWSVTYNDYHVPEYDKLNLHFDTNELPMQFVGKGFGDFRQDSNKIVLTTYHSSKGLDFDLVYLPFCSETRWETVNLYDEEDGKSIDALGQNAPVDKDAVLFMVAMTRSRGDLVISYSGTLNQYVDTFKSECTYKDLDKDNIPDIPGLWPEGDSKNSSDKGDDIFDW